MMTTADAQAWIRMLTVSKSSGESANLCQTDIIGSSYKVDITICGVRTSYIEL